VSGGWPEMMREAWRVLTVVGFLQMRERWMVGGSGSGRWLLGV